MAKLFDDVLKQGLEKNIIPAKTQQARDWYRNKAKSLGTVNEYKFFSDPENIFQNRALVGNMFMFYYDPKMKDELPYYDRVPLVFPFTKTPDGFLGMNMHYLQWEYRARLMDALYELRSNSNYDDTTKLMITYKLLNTTARYHYFKPTVKHYLGNHIRSRLILINPEEWDIALFLNIAKFEKTTQQQVWADTNRMLRGT